MHPECKITIDGKLASGPFMERIISCEVSDADGAESDSVSIELNDFPVAAIPRKGAIIRVWMGYQETGQQFLGAFTADEVSVKAAPYTMSISGKGADFRAEMKEPKERHWDDKTLGDVVNQIAGDHGLTAKVDPAIGSFKFPWLGQNMESDMELLQRLADRHNGLFSIKDGAVIFAERGSGKTPSGNPIGNVVVEKERLLVGSASFNFSDRSEYKEVEASWQDHGEAKRKTTTAPSSDTGKAKFVIAEPMASEAEAKAKAGAKAKDLKRANVTASCSVIGDASIRAGSTFSFKGVRPGVDGLQFIIKTATHSFAKNGYTTAIDGDQQV